MNGTKTWAKWIKIILNMKNMKKLEGQLEELSEELQKNQDLIKEIYTKNRLYLRVYSRRENIKLKSP